MENTTSFTQIVDSLRKAEPLADEALENVLQHFREAQSPTAPTRFLVSIQLPGHVGMSVVDAVGVLTIETNADTEPEFIRPRYVLEMIIQSDAEIHPPAGEARWGWMAVLNGVRAQDPAEFMQHLGVEVGVIKDSDQFHVSVSQDTKNEHFAVVKMMTHDTLVSGMFAAANRVEHGKDTMLALVNVASAFHAALGVQEELPFAISPLPAAWLASPDWPAQLNT